MIFRCMELYDLSQRECLEWEDNELECLEMTQKVEEGAHKGDYKGAHRDVGIK